GHGTHIAAWQESRRADLRTGGRIAADLTNVKVNRRGQCVRNEQPDGRTRDRPLAPVGALIVRHKSTGRTLSACELRRGQVPRAALAALACPGLSCPSPSGCICGYPGVGFFAPKVTAGQPRA